MAIGISNARCQKSIIEILTISKHIKYMKKADKISTAEKQYKIQGYHIIDTKGELNDGKPIYIREILDSGCAEFEFCKVSYRDRLDIIGVIGLKVLIPVLEECFKNGKKKYNAENEATLTTWLLLCRVYPGLHPQLVDDGSGSKRVLQLVNYENL